MSNGNINNRLVRSSGYLSDASGSAISDLGVPDFPKHSTLSESSFAASEPSLTSGQSQARDWNFDLELEQFISGNPFHESSSAPQEVPSAISQIQSNVVETIVRKGNCSAKQTDTRYVTFS